MKIKTTKFLTFLLGVILSFSLFAFFACSGRAKLPVSAYEKVSFAFNGVEKSFRSAAKSNSPKTAHAEERSSAAFDNALSAIRGVYENGDNQGDIIDELEYDQPPMIQFQCLKKVLENIGANFSLGTKYYYDIQGEMYMDSETGFQVDSTAANAQDYKYSYIFGFAICIDIDETDIITAEVSFDIHLERDGENYDTLWFVRLVLDYDMTNAAPNYSLSMFTENDETDLPFYNADTYEYDFVNVKNNVITEWRKFCYSTDRKVVIDETHDDFSDYIAEGIKYDADTCKWYENKSLRKITRITEEKKQTVAGALFGGIGLNSTDINAQPFIDKQGEKTTVINNLYAEMSNLFRKDVIYSLVCKDNGGNSDDNGNNNGDNGGNGGNAGQSYSHIGFFIDGELVNEIRVLSDMTGERFLKDCVEFYYLDDTAGKAEWITNFSSAKFMFYGFNDLNTPNVSLSFQDFITSNMENILSFCDYNGVMKIVLGNAVGIALIYYGDNQGNNQGDNPNDSDDDNNSSEILSEMEEIGFLSYDTQNGTIYATKENDRYSITVNGTTDGEIAAYKSKLLNNGFVQTEYDEYGAKINGNSALSVRFNKSFSDELTFSVAVIENGFSEWPAGSISEWLNEFNFPQPTGAQVYYKAGLYSDKGVAVYGMTDNEIQTFIDGLSSLGCVVNGEYQCFFVYECNVYVYTIEIDKNEYNIYFDFDLDRNPPQQLYEFYVYANSGNPVCLQWEINESDRRIAYSATLALTENDTVSFSEAGETLPHVELKSMYFDRNNENEFTVKTSGTYKFTIRDYDGFSAMIDVNLINI